MLAVVIYFVSQEYSVQMKELYDPPEGYHSVKGVGTTEESDSFFKVYFHISLLKLNPSSLIFPPSSSLLLFPLPSSFLLPLPSSSSLFPPLLILPPTPTSIPC